MIGETDTAYQEVVREAVQNEETFLQLTVKCRQGPWRQVVVRPVLVKQARHLQFSYFSEKQDITKNYRGEEALAKLEELFALPLLSISLRSTQADIQVQITKKGKVILHRSQPRDEKQVVDLAHDAKKALPLPTDKADPFLQTIGVMNQQGKIIAGMHDKFVQINEFLKLLEHTKGIEEIQKRPLTILDCGSGSAYLSFAVYHYLNHTRGIEAHLVGIDTNPVVIEKSNAHSRELGFTQACFKQEAIIKYQPETPPDIVLALHACDTATDEALVQGILNQAYIILCAPCCHHELQQQMTTIHPFDPVLRYGILKKRMGDILTDTFRALALRIAGYRTDVVEFVSSEHTDRNVMIRAVKQRSGSSTGALREYEELKTFWQVTPYIERLLRERGQWPEKGKHDEEERAEVYY